MQISSSSHNYTVIRNKLPSCCFLSASLINLVIRQLMKLVWQEIHSKNGEGCVCVCMCRDERCCTNPEIEAVPGSPLRLSASLLPPVSCTHRSPALLSPTHHAQHPLAAHHLLHKAFVNWEGGPSVLQSPLRAETPNSPSLLAQGPLQVPISHCLMFTAPACVQAVFQRWPSPLSGDLLWARLLSRGH